MIELDRVLAVVMLLLAGSADRAAAQGAGPALRPNRVMVSAGVITSGGYAIGDPRAELRANSTGTLSPFTLFRAESALDRVTGVEARVGFALSRLVAVEVGGSYTRPQLGIRIVQDGEANLTSLAAEDISQYIVDVSGVFQLSRPKLGARARTYAIGGGGYVRQLHEDRFLVETGRNVHVGGGVRYWLRGGSPARRGLGLRGEVRYIRRFGGIDFEEKSRGYPAVSLLAFAGF